MQEKVELKGKPTNKPGERTWRFGDMFRSLELLRQPQTVDDRGFVFTKHRPQVR